MKFLCPSCKAKYQIGDDKVAGRSVRMKCRKCGYLISIAKAVTDGSVSRNLSSMPPPPEAEVPEPSPGWREPGARTSQPGPPPRPPPRPAGRPGAGPVAPPARLGAAGAATSAVTPARPTAPGHSPKNGNGSSSHHAFRVEPPTVHRDDDERTVIAGAGALSSAFAESVAGPESSTLAASLAVTDEWYVGINGVPVGPIRLSELRSKATSGSISNESLVWREGFEQWLPLSNFPELVAIVEEGLSSARASINPLSAAASLQAATPPQAPRPEVYDPFAVPGGTPVVAQDPFQEMLRPSQPVPEAFAASTLGTGQTPLGLVTAPSGGAPEVEMEEVVLSRRRSGSGMFAWVAVGVALLLGLTIGFVMFSRKPPEPVVKYVEVPAKGGEAPVVNSAGGGAIGEVVVDVDAGAGKTTRPGGTVAVAGKAGGEKPEEKPITGLSGLSGLQGGGPTSGPGTSSNPGSTGGQPLDSGEIQKTVGKYTGSVKRSCWQPALDARSKDAPTSARVNVAIVVSPSGSVQSVSTSGDPKGYPGLASCIAARVKGWQFASSSGSTTVNVPFVFAAQ